MRMDCKFQFWILLILLLFEGTDHERCERRLPSLGRPAAAQRRLRAKLREDAQRAGDLAPATVAH